MDGRSIVADEHVAPLAPAALMAAIGLLLCAHLAYPLEGVTQTRRKYPGGTARGALHANKSFRGAPKDYHSAEP